MSGMSSILASLHATHDSSRNELIERGTALRDGGIPSGRSPFFIRLVVRGSFPVEQDVKYAAHAAHAVDPSVLDASPFAPNFRAPVPCQLVASRPLNYRSDVAARRRRVATLFQRVS